MIPATVRTTLAGENPLPPETSRGEFNLAGVERNAWLLTIVLTLASLIFGSRGVTLGIALGGLLAILNFFGLKIFVQNIFKRRGGRINRWGMVLYLLKYILTGAVIFYVVKYKLINVFALLAGLMVVIIVVTVEGMIRTSRPSKEEDDAA